MVQSLPVPILSFNKSYTSSVFYLREKPNGSPKARANSYGGQENTSGNLWRGSIDK